MKYVWKCAMIMNTRGWGFSQPSKLMGIWDDVRLVWTFYQENLLGAIYRDRVTTLLEPELDQ